jgi:acyl-CoA synthetase (AMP-forming)/AMP-acid ligase II
VNFAVFSGLNASKFPEREFLIESYPSRNFRRSVSWREYNEQANRLAGYLIRHCGVKHGDIVLHMMTNSIEWHASYIGVLKTGATITPLNYRFASSDINYAADVTRCKVFIFSEQFIPKIEPIREKMDYCGFFICLGNHVPEGMISYRDIVEQPSDEKICIETADDDTAELMFTSGTTGPPKPVAQSHKNLFFTGVGNGLTLNDGYYSVYLAPHPFYHSGSLFHSFPSYIAAGKILMPMEFQPEFYIRSIAEERCTGGFNTVPTWSDMINAIKEGKIQLKDYDLSALKHIELGAQPVPHVLMEDSKMIFPHIRFGITYGITEGGGGFSAICYDEDILKKPGSIGRATAFMEIKIVDKEGNEAAPMAIGEILLKGPRLMKEYAFNPESTAQTIVNGWLHTGDLGYKDKDGLIFFTDRAKDLIIRGGENIFPVEVEDFLRRHPKIRDVAVIGYPHPRLVEITMAVIQTKEGRTITEEEIKDFCKASGLAKYKWPEKFVFAPVPRNPSGKIEKPKLRETYVKPVKEFLERKS